MNSKKLHPHSELTMQKFKKLPVVTQLRLHTWSNIDGIEIIEYLTQELDLAKKAFTAAFQFDIKSLQYIRLNNLFHQLRLCKVHDDPAEAVSRSQSHLQQPGIDILRVFVRMPQLSGALGA